MRTSQEVGSNLKEHRVIILNTKDQLITLTIWTESPEGQLI
jgi:hypothetical protein